MAPPTLKKKQQAAAVAALAKQREIHSEASAAAEKDPAHELQIAKLQVDEFELLLSQKSSECLQLESLLSQKNSEYAKLESLLEKSKIKLATHKADALLWKSKHEIVYHELCMQHQTVQHGQAKLGCLNLQELFSIIKMTRKVIMTSFGIGGGNMLGHHLHFLTHPTIGSNHIVMHLLLLSSTKTNSLNFLRACM
jgi:hypothetical protein